MSEERKKSGAEKAVDKAEARARGKMLAAITAWLPNRQAQHGFAGDSCADLDACSEFTKSLGGREPWTGADK